MSIVEIVSIFVCPYQGWIHGEAIYQGPVLILQDESSYRQIFQFIYRSHDNMKIFFRRKKIRTRLRTFNPNSIGIFFLKLIVWGERSLI